MPPKIPGPPKSQIKARAAAKARNAKNKSSLSLTQANLNKAYADGAKLILQYLNGNNVTSNFYKAILTESKKKQKTLQAKARDWCFDYQPERVATFTFPPPRNVKGKRTIAIFQKKFPLHEHKGYHHEVKTSAGPHRESKDLEPNEVDNPWILFHPTLFIPMRDASSYRFNMERVITAQTMEGHQNEEELEFTDYTQFIANAPSARRLEGDQFEFALRVTEMLADEEDKERAEEIKEIENARKKAAEKKKNKKKQKAPKVEKLIDFSDDEKEEEAVEEEEEEEDDEEEEPLPVQMTAVTARDLVLDRVLLRYMPEFMVWLGYGPKAWADVKISDEQTRIYKTINLMNSINLMHMRSECIRFVQLTNGEIPWEPNAMTIKEFNKRNSGEEAPKPESVTSVEE